MLRSEFLHYAQLWVGRHYIWGGDDFSGFDCSGYVIECLQAVGKLPHGYDTTAAGLYHRYITQRLDDNLPQAGCLIFWFNRQGVAIHVEIALNHWQTIGASGGGSPRLNIDQLISRNELLQRLAANPDFKSANPDLSWWLQRSIYYQEAVKRNAFIKIRPVIYRGPGYRVCDPFEVPA